MTNFNINADEEKFTTIEEILNSDLSGYFDITGDEASRIAERADNAEEWLEIWENEDWWVD